jgi:pilus assembly protein CpaE
LVLHKAEITLVGCSREPLSAVADTLQDQKSMTVTSRMYGNGYTEMWPADQPAPHALVLCLGIDWQTDLALLLNGLPGKRPPFLVVSPVTEIELFRLAMRAGARDVVQSTSIDPDEFSQRLVDLAHEGREGKADRSARLIAFVNAKGGSGASFLAANVASVLAVRELHRIMLVDLDVQFASLPSYLNMGAGNGLIKALESAESLDATAIKGYAQVHKNGVHLLAAALNDLVSPDDIAQERIEALLNVLDAAYDDIVVDLPRRIDAVTSVIFDRLDKVVVVSQQSVTHLQDTKRLVTIMHNFLGISNDRILIVINRFEKKSDVRRGDFEEAFPGIEIQTIPSDYRRVAESVNLGVPVAEVAERSSLAKAIVALSEHVAPQEDMSAKKRSGVLRWLGVPSRR